nr:restriction endonuclease subunit S [Paenibacillus hamazuiensis]
MDIFGDPVVNDRDWQKVKLSHHIINIESGWSPVCKTNQAHGDEWGVLKLSAITSGSYIATENKAITEDTTPRSGLEVKKDDLLFVRKNTLELVGTCAYVFDTPPKLMLPDTIFRFILKEDSKINKLFLWHLFNNPNYKKQIQKLAGGTAGSMPNISKSKLLSFEIINPDFGLQEKFSKIVIQVEQQKRKQMKSLQQLETNFQALLQKAFKGELTAKEGVPV